MYVPISLSPTLTIPAPSDDAVKKNYIEIKSSLPVNLWYKTAALNDNLQKCMHYLLQNVILLGMINTFHMRKRYIILW